MYYNTLFLAISIDKCITCLLELEIDKTLSLLGTLCLNKDKLQSKDGENNGVAMGPV